MKAIKRLNGVLVAESKHTRILKDRVRFPSDYESDYLYVDRDNSVAILPLLEEGGEIYTLLVTQYRYPIKQALYQFPMGFLENKTTPIKQASSETEEETGFIAHKLEEIARYFHDPGLNTQKTIVFVGRELKITSQKLEKTEDIKVKKVPVASLNKMIEAGEICDALTIALVHQLQLYLQDSNTRGT